MTLSVDRGSRSGSADRLVALVVYGLLIAAPFTLGALAVLAMLIAYVWRGRAEPLAKSHFERQIRSFWMDLIVLVIGFICGWGALGAGIGAALVAAGFPLPGNWSAGPIGAGALVLAAIWLFAWAMGLGGLVLGSILGAMRLASGQPARKTRP
jgi:uncharacterized membrane protein